MISRARVIDRCAQNCVRYELLKTFTCKNVDTFPPKKLSAEKNEFPMDSVSVPDSGTLSTVRMGV